MTIKTLNYIHQLLLQEAETQRATYKQARQADADADYDEDLREPMDKAWAAWDKARTALYEFEDKEW